MGIDIDEMGKKLHAKLDSGIDRLQLENQLLRWQTDGYLHVYPGGRRVMVELLAPPDDAGSRIDSLLSRYNAIQAQRVAEIADYARTERCRHGYLANYLGGHDRWHCDACDNCLEGGSRRG